MASTKMLDTSDKSRILSDGMEIVDEWMSGTDLFEDVCGKLGQENEMQPFQISTEEPIAKGDDSNILLRCEICGISMTGKENW
uniref:Uncharacterized protein n=1 Tax=Caenorhabditis japonica TaxID=281687 RepID=A0A8R1HLT3_CAEJA